MKTAIFVGPLSTVTPSRIHTILASGKGISFTDPGKHAWSRKSVQELFTADFVFDFCDPFLGHEDGLTERPEWQVKADSYSTVFGTLWA